MKSKWFWIFSALFALFPVPTIAQQHSVPANPISDKELNLLLVGAALTTCELASNKVSYDISVQSSSSSVVSVIGQIFGGKIASVSTALTPQQIFSVVSTEVALRTNSICPKVVPEDTKKQLLQIVKNRQEFKAK